MPNQTYIYDLVSVSGETITLRNNVRAGRVVVVNHETFGRHLAGGSVNPASVVRLLAGGCVLWAALFDLYNCPDLRLDTLEPETVKAKDAAVRILDDSSKEFAVSSNRAGLLI